MALKVKNQVISTAQSERTTLPKDGMSRFKQFQTFLPVSRETWRKLVRDKRAPQPVRMGV